MTQQQLVNEALALPAEERAKLAETLMESLGNEDQKEVDTAWAREAERRIEAVKTGKMGTIPAEEVFRRLRERGL